MPVLGPHWSWTTQIQVRPRTKLAKLEHVRGLKKSTHDEPQTHLEAPIRRLLFKRLRKPAQEPTEEPDVEFSEAHGKPRWFLKITVQRSGARLRIWS